MLLKHDTQNVIEKPFSEHFLKNQNQAYFWINSLKFYTVYFYCIPSCKQSKNIKNKLPPLAFISHKAFLKDNYRSGNGLLASYSAQFLKKIASLVIFLLTDQILMSGCRYFVINWAICVLQLFVFYVVMSNFETNLIFLIRPFFLHSQKFNTNI